jgi:hypothetical protein
LYVADGRPGQHRPFPLITDGRSIVGSRIGGIAGT